MKKIIVIGCPGSGKSTFSKKLSGKTGIELYHLDMIWHKPDRTNISTEDFDNQLNAIMKKEQWIIDGNYGRTLDTRFEHSDTIFLLDYPLEVCLEGVERRIGKKRDDMPWIETEFEDEFKQWIVDFPQNELPQIYRLIEQYRSSRQIYIFHTRQEAKQMLEKL